MTEQKMKTLAAKLGAEQEELKPYFAQVCPKPDWKSPIDAFCRREDLSQVMRAIEFFTATLTTYLEVVPPCKEWVRVQSIGYRAGPAGDH
jgi:hypothetical protein